MRRKIRRIVRYVRWLLDDVRGPHLLRKLDQWDGSCWALEEIKLGHLHHVEFILDNSAYDRDAHREDFLRGARETLISMMMLPAAAEYVREVEAALAKKRLV